MEVNNNDPNNNDVVLLDRMEEPNIEPGMGQAATSRSQSDDEPNNLHMYNSDESFSDDSSGPPDRDSYNHGGGKSFFETDSEVEESGSGSIHDYLDSDIESDDAMSDDNFSYNCNNSSNDRTIDVDNDECFIVENANNEMTEEENVPEEVADMNVATKSEDLPSTSTSTFLADDYHTIKKIAPKLSDNLIFKFLHRNEDHENRLLASVWDLMHAINRPRSKKDPIIRTYKKKRQKNSVEPVLPVPGRPEVYMRGNVQVTSTEMQLQNLENRKDYKKVPKRAPETITSGELYNDAKKRKIGDENPIPSTSASGSGSGGKINSVILSPAKLVLPSVLPIERAIIAARKVIRNELLQQTASHEDANLKLAEILKGRTVPATASSSSKANKTDVNNVHVKIPGKQLAAYLVSACEDANASTSSSLSIIKPATLNAGPSTSTGAVNISNTKPYVINVPDPTSPKEPYIFTEEELRMDLELEISKLMHKDIFNQLTVMFENVRREYILKLCMNCEKMMDKQQMTNHLTDVLLIMGPSYHKVVETEQKQKINLQENYNNLLEIFPDACPDYLKQQATKYANDPENLQQFVQVTLMNNNYPTKEEYLKKQKLRNQLETYINNFNVQQFLEIIPDPVAFFEDPTRSSNREMASNYLKKHYNQVRLDTIRQALRTANYNLSLAVKILDKIKSNMKTKRNNYHLLPVGTENILFAQEVAFIRHRKEIEDYIQSVKDQEKNEYETLKRQGGFLECQCCFSDECLPSKSSYCEKGHAFCNSCIIRGTESTMADGNTHVNCFAGCGAEFSLAVLQKVLKPAQFSILLTKRQEAEVRAAGLEGLVSCPFCHFASIPPTEDKVFKCLNLDCMKETCRFCKELNHIPQTCEEAKATDSATHYLEEKMTEALIRICYQCKKPFFKEEGCNKMTCTCGAKMCYICGQPVKDYSHFRGQGNDSLNLCPLYTDDAHMNAAVVRRVAETTAQSLQSKDPNVKLQIEKLLPVLPAPKKTGPHNEIIRPLNLPEHALRARPYAGNR